MPSPFLRPALAPLLALTLTVLAAAAPQKLLPGASLELKLTASAPQTAFTFTQDGQRLLALRVSSTTTSKAAVAFDAKAAATFGELELTSDFRWEFNPVRGASQLCDVLPQYPATWTITVSFVTEETPALTCTVQLEDQGPAPAIVWGEALGTLRVRHAEKTELSAEPEKNALVQHPAFASGSVPAETAPNGDAVFKLPAGYWQLVATDKAVRQSRAALIPVSSGGETVVEWPRMRPLAGKADRPPALADLLLHEATAEGANVRLTVSAPMFEQAPPLAAVHLVEGGQPGEVLSIEPIPSKLHVVVLFDSSLSMRKIFPQAQAAVLRFVEQLPPGGTVDFFDFDTKVKELPATDRPALLAAIRGIQADGSTKLYDAVMRGLGKCAGHRRSAVVLFTDGFDAQVEDPGYGSRATAAQVDAAVRTAGVPLFTIAYGEKPDEATLTRLAKNSSGTFFRAQADTIGNVFDEIGRLVVRDYRITYRRPAKVTASNTPVLTLVLDVSGSMDMDPTTEGCDFRIEKAKDLLRGFFGRLPAGSIVQLFTFSSAVDLVQVPTADTPRLLRALAPLEAGGSTETLAATNAALASIARIPSRSRFLLFVTDAALEVEAAQRTEFEESLAELKKLNVRSLWVGMVGAKDQAPFARAAELSGGSFVVSPSTDSLAQALASLEKTLNEPGAGGGIGIDLTIDKPVPGAPPRTYGGSGVFPLPVPPSTAEQGVGCLTVSIKNSVTAPAPAGPTIQPPAETPAAPEVPDEPTEPVAPAG